MDTTSPMILIDSLGLTCFNINRTAQNHPKPMAVDAACPAACTAFRGGDLLPLDSRQQISYDKFSFFFFFNGFLLILCLKPGSLALLHPHKKEQPFGGP